MIDNLRLSPNRAKKIKTVEQSSQMEWRILVPQHTAPVVVGGVGGSGTRLIAQCLSEAGLFMGSDLNAAYDNLWFTFLFKRVEVLSSSDEAFDELLNILVGRMIGEQKFNKQQVDLISVLSDRDREQHSAIWLKKRAETLLSGKSAFMSKKKGGGWGWKEPNSHIVLNRLFDRLPDMKYVHVVRNGLDMAHSKNQNQLKLWGAYFIDEVFDISPYFSLKYWCAIHKRAFRIGSLMNEKFLLLNYDDFCMNPEKGIKNLFGFLGLESDRLFPELMSLVSPPDSIGRFKRFGTGMFAKEDIAFVESLGFDTSC